MFRRAMKRAVQNAMRQGAEGIKVQVGGRLVELRSRVASGIGKVACLCTPCEPTLITQRRRPVPRTGLSV